MGRMLDVEALADLPPRQYLERFHVEFYLQDALSLFLTRRRNDTRSAPEFIGQYLEAVLRGEHVIHRGFSYINSTPLNRRAFVLLVREALSGVADPESTALTAYDFHDLVVQLCTDFPLAVVLEAAHYAERAVQHTNTADKRIDSRKYHLLGQTAPLVGGIAHLASDSLAASGSGGTATNATDVGGRVEATNESSAEHSSLLVFCSLQRLVEFCFVYGELLGVLKRIFQEDVACVPTRQGSGPCTTAPVGCGASIGGTGVTDAAALTAQTPMPCRSVTPVTWTRSALVTELRLCSATLAGAALPSEQALLRLLQPLARVTCAVKTGSVTFREALLEMAEHFELGLDPYPADLVGGAHALLEGHLTDASQNGPSVPPLAATSSMKRSPKSRSRT